MKAGMDALGRVRAQAIVLLVLAFLAGAFAGGAIERVNLRSGARPFRSARRGGAHGPRDGRLPALFDSIGLSTEQRRKVETIVRSRRPKVDTLMTSIRSAMDSTRGEIDRVLTAEQRARLDTLRARNRRGFGQPGGSRRPRPGPDSARP